MGWCSGTLIFDQVCDVLLSNKKVDKQALLETLIEALKDMDWDCECDSEYLHDPIVKAAFINLGYQDMYDNMPEDIEDVSVVMTGFRDVDLQNQIELAGGRVTSSVTGKTTHLLIAGKSAEDGSSKMTKAKQLGVKIMSPAEFIADYGLE